MYAYSSLPGSTLAMALSCGTAAIGDAIYITAIYVLCSATIRLPDRVASFRDVTELLIVVGRRLQELPDVLRGQLVRLDTIG